MPNRLSTELDLKSVKCNTMVRRLSKDSMEAQEQEETEIQRARNTPKTEAQKQGQAAQR